MIGNEFSQRELSLRALDWVTQLHHQLKMKFKGKGTIRSYCQEITLLFKYYCHKPVEDISQQDIRQYLVYIQQVHKVGRAKCRSVASACSYFFKHVIQKPFVLPSDLYPQKQFMLPDIMSQQQVQQLLNANLTLREKCVVGLCYGAGLRISEVAALTIKDIDSTAKRLKIVQGKGAKDRYTLLPDTLLQTLRAFYVQQGKPTQYLFTSKQSAKALHPRSLQTTVNSAMIKAGFENGRFTAHTLRHSFATHMLDNGSNIHIIKTLLGHSKIETTMIYLHLQQHVQFGIVSPLDVLYNATKH
jgi:integrase/recombinase XerD